MKLPEPVHAPAMPPISFVLPADSGLVLVETSHRDATPPVTEEAEATRPKRVRPARVETASESLEIVETRKEPQPPSP